MPIAGADEGLLELDGFVHHQGTKAPRKGRGRRSVGKSDWKSDWRADAVRGRWRDEGVEEAIEIRELPLASAC